MKICENSGFLVSELIVGSVDQLDKYMKINQFLNDYKSESSISKFGLISTF